MLPAGDPTLLFTNAGMVQFKDVFLGRERRAYTRAATLQKCMRVQGKHNDLDNVGPSPWHHTFFQMLGNFSFGEYFKPEAVAYAWELMTKGYGVDPQRLTITVHTTDQDAAAAWRVVGVPDSRILRLGDTTNFWMMADVGPCGPTSELHYDWGPQHCTCARPDCSVALDNGCLRWLEIWNLVFMQLDERADGACVLLFSSRRRHTRSDRDWSSDVCSSDLVLPRLAPGVLVHVHDIFLPYDYPQEWLKGRFFWNEQYVLHALLIHSNSFEVMWSQR